jgi:N-methylhydantoinase A/oxoprolinase/acetone carboxylase beta subunit
MRYLHQGFEIRVPLPSEPLTTHDLPLLRKAFSREYERLYKRLNPGVEIEIVNWRLVAAGPQPSIVLQTPETEARSLVAAHKGDREIYLPEHNSFLPCHVYDRYRLPIKTPFTGPAIIEERECTVVIGMNAQVLVDRDFNLVVTLL